MARSAMHFWRFVIGLESGKKTSFDETKFIVDQIGTKAISAPGGVGWGGGGGQHP